MQHTFMRKLFLLFILSFMGMAAVHAQSPIQLDTIYNPEINYSDSPRSFEIAGISISNVTNKDEYVLVSLSGLSVGQRIYIPGEEISAAVKRLWKQGLFSDVSIKVVKTYGDKVWLDISLKQRPRISSITYSGIRKSDREDLDMRIGLVKGSQISPNLIDRAKTVIHKYYEEKGYGNIAVQITQEEDPDREDFVNVHIAIDKKAKIKVRKIEIEGNLALSDRKIKRAMKKTNEKGKIYNLFRPKKFVKEELQNDLNLILDKYNELGYRDATIVEDTFWMSGEKTVDVKIKIDEGKKYYIRDIRWVGNELYPTEYLGEILNIKSGDVYNQKLLQQRLKEDNDAVSNLYLDQGYLFFNVMPTELNIVEDSVDLEMRIYEGEQARVNKVIIQGNDKVYEHVVRRELRTRPGELFSKSDLLRSVREIQQLGHFDPETINPQAQPDPENSTVDIVYGLEPKASDQVELSAGWGQTGIVGRLSLKFSNFSIRNLFNPKAYKGIIPQGDGQQLTLSAQTNARYYQSYMISFMDPWFGGKRPNLLSVTAYYSRQTDISTNYYNRNYLTSYNSYYGYSNSGYDYSFAMDPDKSLQLFGLAVGFGKRLVWPDDYFTFNAELGYQLYKLKDWEYIRYFRNGKSNSLSLTLTLARNSIDNPIYTRIGSQFSLSVQATPPYSLFDNIDYENLDKNDEKDQQKMYRWIEYHKWKFKAKTFTPLTPMGNEKQRTLVLMTRAEFGFLGSYNKYKKSPFETFYVGGDGMTGYSSSYATEIIALRGYENGSLTPYGAEGYCYTRLGAELRFPLLLEPASTIYMLTFVEGGNAWTDVSDFNPFQLKRSAGIGARIFLPMVGMMGIDYAYGFDKVYGQKGGNQIHFILGQEF